MEINIFVILAKKKSIEPAKNNGHSLSDFISTMDYITNSNDPEDDVFFYHSDHLGGANWITTAEGSSVRSFVVGR